VLDSHFTVEPFSTTEESGFSFRSRPDRWVVQLFLKPVNGSA